MAKMAAIDESAIFDDHDEAVPHIWNYMHHFANSMAMKCAVELRIADIIQSLGQPITLSEIASEINSPSLDISNLERVMRMLVRMKIFTSTTPSNGGDINTLYGMTPSAKFLLHDAEVSLAPMVLMQTHPTIQAPWHYLSRCVKEGGCGFTKAHGCKLTEIMASNPEYNKLLNDAMESCSKIFVKGIISKYRDGFQCIGSLVDVGGNTGQSLAQIVKAFPHIKGINFDLPHVVSTAPEISGVTHVSGDMFQAIPAADAVYIKQVLHNWGDEDCVKILKNCRKAITGKPGGKIIIIEPIVKAEADKLYENTDLVWDLLMMAVMDGAKERTELQWRKILEEAGFPSYKIIQMPNFYSIIEAYPE